MDNDHVLVAIRVLKEKNYFAHNFDELDECSDIIQSTNRPGAGEIINILLVA